MSTEAEMVQVLDGKFYSFEYDGKLRVVVKEVSKTYCPTYDFEIKTLAGARRGGYDRAKQQAKRIAAFWTKEKIAKLLEFQARGDSARKIGHLLGTSRQIVGLQLNRMGIKSRYDVPYCIELKTAQPIPGGVESAA